MSCNCHKDQIPANLTITKRPIFGWMIDDGKHLVPVNLIEDLNLLYLLGQRFGDEPDFLNAVKAQMDYVKAVGQEKAEAQDELFDSLLKLLESIANSLPEASKPAAEEATVKQLQSEFGVEELKEKLKLNKKCTLIGTWGAASLSLVRGDNAEIKYRDKNGRMAVIVGPIEECLELLTHRFN